MSFSDYTEQGLLNSYFGNTSAFGTLSSRPNIFVGLSSTAPNDAGANVTEPVGNAYARVATTPGDWNNAAAGDPSSVTNANAITFAEATGDWVGGANLTHAVFYDSLSGGNYLGAGPLAVPKPVTNGDTAEFAASDITWTLD